MFRKYFTFLLVIVLGMFCFAAAAAEMPWTICVSNIAESAYTDFSCAAADGPVRIQLSAADGRGAVVLTVGSKRATAVVKDSEYFKEKKPVFVLPHFNRQSSAATVKLAFRRYRQRCTVYVDGVPVALAPDCWDGAMSISLPVDEMSETYDVYVQELGRFSFSDAFMVDENDKTALQNWDVASGEWSLHAVTGRTVRATDNKKLPSFPIPANSPNFYSLNGAGHCAAILTGESFYSHYSVSASVQHNGGTNGIIFLVSDAPSGFAFTVETASDGKLVFALRSKCIPGETSGEVIKAVKTELSPGQWYLLEARVTENTITCLVDNIPVLRHVAALPAGGFFGLFSDSLPEHENRFDDVFAGTFDGFDASTAAEAAMCELPFCRNSAKVFGCTNDPPASVTLEADLERLFTESEITLEIGVTAPDAIPAYAFTVSRKMNALRFQLARDGVVVDTADASADSITFPAEFTLDGTSDGVVVARVNNKTVLLASASQPPSGAAGFSVSGDGFKVAQFPVISRHKPFYTDRFEKNKVYVDDQFMRHWASTAGQWLTYTNGTAWYKDDVLNRVALTFPVIDDLELHLDTPDGVENGSFRIASEKGTLTISQLTQTNTYTTLYTWDYPSATLVGDSMALTATNTVTLRLDGHRFMFSSASGAVFSCAAPFPHRGRKMFFKKVPAKFMGNIMVVREPVIDCLFSESIHDWFINGGQWEIINRFQCQPRWSHMDGENPDSVAALWSKYEIGGDFSMTFIAGMRHGWYHRVGDMNITLLNRINTPSQGYTLTVTGWDPDESQIWTSLYRDGNLLTKTDKYAAPRRREGNVRKVYEPLLASGRDVHGAWYTINLRKNGHEISAFFDNALLLKATDPEPLEFGSFGIWTYRNSMVVARVRVTADIIRPRPFAFSEIKYNTSDYRDENPQISSLSKLSFNGLPTDLLRPDLWRASDGVSFPEVKFSVEDDETVMTVTSTHGSGSFLVAPTDALPSVTGAQVAGWRFDVARSENAQFNFEYEYAPTNRAGLYTHVISGSKSRLGPRIITGTSPSVPFTKHGASKVWTPVTVWLPAIGERSVDCVAKISGFGNLQPSDIQQGLFGNAPGEWYAVRRMRPIYRGQPIPDNSSDNTEAFSENITTALQKGIAGRVNTFMLNAKKHNGLIEWTLPPADNPGLLASYVPVPHDVIRIQSSLPWPNPLLSTSNVTVNGKSMILAGIKDNVLTIPIERPFFPLSNSSAVKVSFTTTSGRPFTQMLPVSVFSRKSGAPVRPPVLASIEFPPELGAVYENFEGRGVDGSRFTIARNAPMDYSPSINVGDTVQCTYLRESNDGQRNRNLSLKLFDSFDITLTPFLQFRYRGDKMALVNIFPKPPAVFLFSEPQDSTNKSTPAILNNNWHTVLCRLTDAEATRSLQEFLNTQTSALMIGSERIIGRRGNQTGCFSHIDLDEITLGPAVGPRNKEFFAFRPVFDAQDGITAAEYAIIHGGKPLDALSTNEMADAVWVAFDHSSTNWVRPDISVLNDGQYHLAVRAKGIDGVCSRIADIPFLLDTVSPTASVDVAQDDLNIVLDGADGAFPTFTGAELTASGKPMKLSRSSSGTATAFSTNRIIFTVKWPFVLRDDIQAATNRTVFTVKASNLKDGAGNIAADVYRDIRLDYESDRTPPVISNPRLPLYIDGVGMPNQNAFFKGYGNALEVRYTALTATNPPYISIKVPAAKVNQNAWNRQAFTACNINSIFWNTATNRWLLLRVRVPEKSTNLKLGEEAFKLHFTLSEVPNGAKNARKDKIYSEKIIYTNAPASYDVKAFYGNYDFTPGKWVDIAVDCDALLKHLVGTDQSVNITRFAIVMPDISDYTLDICAAAVMRNWSEKLVLNWNAYDASGIEGVFMNDTKLSNTWMIKLSETAIPDKNVFFYPLGVRDRAGNRAPQMLVPFPPVEK